MRIASKNTYDYFENDVTLRQEKEDHRVDSRNMRKVEDAIRSRLSVFEAIFNIAT